MFDRGKAMIAARRRALDVPDRSEASICCTSQQTARGGQDRSAPEAATAVAEEVSRGNDTFRSDGLLASVRQLSIVT